MSVISASNNTIFRDSSIMISDIRRFLKSYVTLFDEGDFYQYMMDIINQLGIGVYKESQAIVFVENFKAKLPSNFSKLYSAYKVTPTFNHKDLIHPQDSTSWVMKNDITSELIVEGGDCTIDCTTKDQSIIEKFTVRNYVNEGAILNFENPILLRLSPNVKRDSIVQDSICLSASSPFEIGIDGKILYTNFAKDSVYIKYYGLPLDPESGLPQIPDVTSVENAIKWYIIYQVLLQLWFNSEVPNIQNLWQKAEAEYKHWFAQALYEVKLPTFQSMIDKALLNRKSLDVYRQIL